MVSIINVKLGIEKYIEQEIINKLDGWRKWTVGAAVALKLENLPNIFEEIKENQQIKDLNIIVDDEIDIDTIYKYLSEQAKKEALTMSYPILGIIKFTHHDLEKLYYIIKEI